MKFTPLPSVPETSPLRDCLGMSRWEAFRVRFQCPRQAWDDYLAAAAGLRGPAPPIIAVMAPAVLPHLEGAVRALEQLARPTCNN